MLTETLETVVMIKGTFNGFPTYSELVEKVSAQISDTEFEDATKIVDTHDICNLQYTSGSTGDPKAAMLTHQ